MFDKLLKGKKKKIKLITFPTVSLILIVVGISGLYISEASEPYLDKGSYMFEKIPEVETYSETGKGNLHMNNDPLGRPSSMSVEVKNLTKNAIIHVSFDVEPGWLIHPPGGENVWLIDAYIFNHENYTMWLAGAEDVTYISKAYEQAGQMYAVVPENGTYYVVFDNSRQGVRSDMYKKVNYNIRAVVPAHTDKTKISSAEKQEFKDSISYPFLGLIFVGIFGVIWWIITLSLYIKRKVLENDETFKEASLLGSKNNTQ